MLLNKFNYKIKNVLAFLLVQVLCLSLMGILMGSWGGERAIATPMETTAPSVVHVSPQQVAAAATASTKSQPTHQRQNNCDPAYPDVCIPAPPPDWDCKDVPERRFRVLPPDPHRFDRDKDGIGCE